MHNRWKQKNYSNQKTLKLAVLMTVLRWIPVLIVFILFVGSFFLYAMEVIYTSEISESAKEIFLVVYTISFVLSVWAYYQTVFPSKYPVPQEFHLAPDVMEYLESKNHTPQQQDQLLLSIAERLPISTISLSGSIRVCWKCQLIKPDRAHHCSVCKRCVLKMDHHCPWVNNCVSFSNYKCFILFVFYTLCLSSFAVASTYQNIFLFSKFDPLKDPNAIILTVTGLSSSLTLLALFLYHVFLLGRNRTTIEAFRPPIFQMAGPNKSGYDCGFCKNFTQVFGRSAMLWLVPIFSSLGNGVVFPQPVNHNYESMGRTSRKQ